MDRDKGFQIVSGGDQRQDGGLLSMLLCRMTRQSAPIPAGIRSDCGRAKYQELAARPGLLARLRLAWFVLIAVIRDRNLP